MKGEQCRATITGHRYATGIVTWRKRCRAKAMGDRAELVGFVEGYCFTHQPAEVRNQIHAQRNRDRVDAGQGR